MDGRRPDALGGREASDDPARRALDLGRRAKGAGVRQPIDERTGNGAARRNAAARI
jgi:hypothetical protein